MLSIIIPCYNSEKYIVRAIESVLNQTYLNYEIILVDNNSSDNTLNILNNYMKKYPETIKVLREQKQGSPAARNKGLLEAKGEWIQFLDADDELLPDKLATQISMVENSAFDVVAGTCCRYKTLIDGRIKERTLRDVEADDLWKGLLTSKLGTTSANLWRREALLAIEGWNENISSSQEYDLLFRLLKNNATVGFSPSVQTILHITENSISSKTNEDRIIEIIHNSICLRMEVKDYLKSKGMLTKELTRCADEYNYSTLVMRSYKQLIPLYFRHGKISTYVKKTLKENPFDVSFIYILKLHARNILNMVLQKIKPYIHSDKISHFKTGKI